VNVNLLVLQLDGLARQADHAFDEVAVRFLGILEHDHVEAFDVLHRQQRAFEAARCRAEDELVDEQVIADEQVFFHRSGGDLERLHDERADEQREDDRDDDRLEVLTQRRLLEGYWLLATGSWLPFALCPLPCHSCSVPILSTARNASCGISTFPTRFMRFLPSFCFSSSLRLREMSPP